MNRDVQELQRRRDALIADLIAHPHNILTIDEFGEVTREMWAALRRAAAALPNPETVVRVPQATRASGPVV